MELQGSMATHIFYIHIFIDWPHYQQLDETSIHTAPCDPKPYGATHGIYMDACP